MGFRQVLRIYSPENTVIRHSENGTLDHFTLWCVLSRIRFLGLNPTCAVQINWHSTDKLRNNCSVGNKVKS